MAAMMAGSAAPTKKAQLVRVTFDRPFGFVVAERTSGLALFVGWVDHPTQLWGASP